MIQTKPYEFMVQYTPQREWIERRGILFWLAFFFIELGAGMFIVASILGSLPGMLIGWLICAILGGGLHLLYLGHPFRFWRILLSSGWKTSWISRGLYFVAIFLALGLIHMILAQWGSPAVGLLIAADVFAFLAVIYGGFAMNYVNSLQMWNSALLPVLYAVAGLWGGLGLTLVVTLATGAAGVVNIVEEWARIFLISFIFIVAIYLMSIRYRGLAGKVSVEEIVIGRWAPLFWVMVVALGMVLPLVVALLGWIGGLAVPMTLLYVAILFELLGDLSLRYCMLRCGFYAPLTPTKSYAY